MPYLAPPRAYAFFCEFIAQLPNYYVGNNQERLAFTNLLQNLLKWMQSHQPDGSNFLSEGQQINLMLAALELARIDIERGYKHLSPERSSYYCMLTEKMAMQGDNRFTLKERFILLADLYHYLEQHADEKLIINTLWKSNQDLLQCIKENLTYLLEKLADEVAVLLSHLPNSAALDQQIQTLALKYEQNAKSKWRLFGDQKNAREELILFMQAVNQFSETVPAELKDTISKTAWLQANQQFIYSVRLGLFTFALEKLKREGSSTLAKLCHQALNIKTIDTLSLKDRIQWLRTLATQLQTMQQNHDNMNGVALEKKVEEINEQLKALELKQNQPTFSQNCIRVLIGASTKYSVSIFAGQFAKQASISALGALAATTPVGTLIFGTSALLTQLATTYISEKVVPRAVTTVYQSALDKASNAIADQAVKPVFFALEMTYEGAKKILGYAQEEGDQLIDDASFQKVLLSLPNDIFPAVNKEKLLQINCEELDESQFMKI